MFKMKAHGRHRRAHQIPQAILAGLFMLAAVPVLFQGTPR